jgi:hypothetical protein
MPVERKQGAYPELSVFVVRGRITRRELEEAIVESYQHSPPQGLWDLREASLEELSGSDLRSLMALVASHAAHHRPTCSAVVAGDEATFGLARMLASYVQDLPLELRTFRRLEDA